MWTESCGCRRRSGGEHGPRPLSQLHRRRAQQVPCRLGRQRRPWHLVSWRSVRLLDAPYNGPALAQACPRSAGAAQPNCASGRTDTCEARNFALAASRRCLVKCSDDQLAPQVRQRSGGSRQWAGHRGRRAPRQDCRHQSGGPPGVLLEAAAVVHMCDLSNRSMPRLQCSNRQGQGRAKTCYHAEINATSKVLALPVAAGFLLSRGHGVRVHARGRQRHPSNQQQLLHRSLAVCLQEQPAAECNRRCCEQVQPVTMLTMSR